MSKKLLYILMFFMPFQSLISREFGINYIHIVLSILIIISGIFGIRHQVVQFQTKIFLLLFVFLSVVLTRFDYYLLLYGALPSIIFPVLFYYVNFNEKLLSDFILINNAILPIISLVALYQFFVDPTFLGLEKTIYLKVGSALFPRVNSIFTSYQTLSTYTSVMIVLNIYQFFKKKSILQFVFIAIAILGLIASFTRNGWVLLIIVLLLHVVFNNRKAFLRVSLSILIVLYIVGLFVPLEIIIDRFLSTFDIGEGGNLGRKEIYLFYMSKMDLGSFIWGHGIGISSQRYALRLNTEYWFSIESQYLKYIFEGGLLYFFTVVFLQAKVVIRLRKFSKNKTLGYLLLAFFPLLLFVHMLEIWPINFLFWFLIMYGIKYENFAHWKN